MGAEIQFGHMVGSVKRAELRAGEERLAKSVERRDGHFTPLRLVLPRVGRKAREKLLRRTQLGLRWLPTEGLRVSRPDTRSAARRECGEFSGPRCRERLHDGTIH